MSFLFKVWALAKPYRWRLIFGIVTGIISGAIEPLMIGTVIFVYAVIFTAAGSGTNLPIKSMPEFLHRWFELARSTVQSGLKTHPTTAFILIAAIPTVVLLRGLFSYLN